MSSQRQTTPRSQPAATKAAADKTEKRPRQPKKAAEPGRREALMARTGRARGLIQDTLSEVRKVNWPDQETTRNLTIVVIGISITMGILLGSVDYALVQLLGLF